MQYALACEDLWCHINTVINLADLLGTPSTLPIPANPANITATERAEMCEWLLNDMKAKDLITHCLSPSIGSLVSHSHTVSAHKYQLHQWLDALRMKDSADATNYVGQHTVLCKCLHDSGAPLRDSDTIYSLLIRLPHMPIWQQFKSMLEQQMHDEIMTATAARPSTFTMDSCISHITAEAACHIHAHAIHSACPSSEYANVVTMSNGSTPSINPITGLHKHRHNPDGVFCTTSGCNKGDYNHAHCYGMGGAMEGQAPWMWNKKDKKDTMHPHLLQFQPLQPHLYDNVSFASITEVMDDVSSTVSLPFSTILDSGTTITLVKDRLFFHTYLTEDPIPVHTANYGVLEMTGRGMCIRWMTIGTRHLRVKLSNYLHVPNAMLNLLSISCMDAKGWDVNFKAKMTCKLGHKGCTLGSIPAMGKLYAIDLDFIPRTEMPVHQHSSKLLAPLTCGMPISVTSVRML
ncbi:hypothetical protein BDR03DRAFT_983095 [Suillus americanus]|nr:hypothetical protein BDR03DRAFT_983095 [Suillus americanus]